MQDETDELTVYIKLKHGGIVGNPRAFVNNLPDEIIDTFYRDTPFSREEKRENAFNFYAANQHRELLLNHEFREIEKDLRKYYEGKGQ